MEQSEDFRKHASGRTTAVGFDAADVGTQDRAERFQKGSLSGVKAFTGCFGHDQKVPALLILYFQHVAGEMFHLSETDLHNGLAGFLQRRHYCLKLFCVLNGIAAEYGKTGTDAHQNVGMIDRLSISVCGIKDNGGISEFIAEISKNMFGSPGRTAGINDPVFSVQYHASGAFQKKSVFFKMGQIQCTLRMEMIPDAVQSIRFPFVSSVLGEHGI